MTSTMVRTLPKSTPSNLSHTTISWLKLDSDLLVQVVSVLCTNFKMVRKWPLSRITHEKCPLPKAGQKRAALYTLAANILNFFFDPDTLIGILSFRVQWSCRPITWKHPVHHGASIRSWVISSPIWRHIPRLRDPRTSTYTHEKHWYVALGIFILTLDVFLAHIC